MVRRISPAMVKHQKGIGQSQRVGAPPFLIFQIHDLTPPPNPLCGLSDRVDIHAGAESRGTAPAARAQADKLGAHYKRASIGKAVSVTRLRSEGQTASAQTST